MTGSGSRLNHFPGRRRHGAAPEQEARYPGGNCRFDEAVRVEARYDSQMRVHRQHPMLAHVTNGGHVHILTLSFNQKDSNYLL